MAILENEGWNLLTGQNEELLSLKKYKIKFQKKIFYDLLQLQTCTRGLMLNIYCYTNFSIFSLN